MTEDFVVIAGVFLICKIPFQAVGFFFSQVAGICRCGIVILLVKKCCDLYRTPESHLRVIVMIASCSGTWCRCLFTVSISEQVAARARNVELSSSDEANSLLILQEHLSLLYTGQ